MEFFYKIQEVRETNANKNPMEPHSLRQLNFSLNVKQRMMCCLSSSVQVVTMTLSPFLFTSLTYPVGKTILPVFGIAKRRLQVCLKIRSNTELQFRLVCFPQTCNQWGWRRSRNIPHWQPAVSLVTVLSSHLHHLSAKGSSPPLSSFPQPLLSLPTWSSHS